MEIPSKHVFQIKDIRFRIVFAFGVNPIVEKTVAVYLVVKSIKRTMYNKKNRLKKTKRLHRMVWRIKISNGPVCF